MPAYCISYDLGPSRSLLQQFFTGRKSGRRMPILLNSLGARFVFHTTWVMKSDLDAIQLRNRLVSSLEPGDRIVVLGLANDWAVGGVDLAGVLTDYVGSPSSARR